MNEHEMQKRPRGRPRSVTADLQGGIVKALDRGLMVLMALSKMGSTTLADLVLQVDMPPSSTHRLLVTLQQHGFVEFEEANQKWAIGVEAFRVGSAYLGRTNLVEAVRKVMSRLMEDTGETANLAITDNGDVVFISQIETQNPIRAFFRPGTRGFMHVSGIGKALMASMPEKELEKIVNKKGLPEFTEKSLTTYPALQTDLELTRSRGWSFDDEECYVGMRCVASVIYNSFGEAIAGVSISGPTVRFPDAAISEFGPVVKQAANEITTMIGGRVPKD